MCSRPRRRFAPLIVALALGLPLSFGCGHKENPKPPPQKIPETIRDLAVSQRGDELMVTFTYPQVTISGLPIDDIVAIELWEFEVPVPEFAIGDEGEDEEGDETTGEGEEPGEGDESDAGDESADGEPQAAETESEPEESAAVASADEPEGGEPSAPGEMPADAPGDAEEPEDAGSDDDDPALADEDEEGDDDDDRRPTMVVASKESLLEVDPREFTVASRLRLTLEGETLSNAIHGATVEITLELDEIEPGEKTALVYGVKSFQSLKRASRFSNLFKIIPRLTPAPPEFELEATSNGVKLAWESAEEEPLEYRFYRRDPLASEFGEFFGSRDGDGDQFLDSTAEAGKSYAYAMTVVVNRSPLVESALSPASEIEYLDVFPPEEPTDLVVLTEVGTARLLWEGSSDPDLAGYVVYRRTGGGDFERLNERPVRQNEFSDTTAESGRSYAYRIVALDREGNMSDPSEEVEVRIP